MQNILLCVAGIVKDTRKLTIVGKEDDDHFRVSVEVAVSPQFYGWVFGLGKMVRIVGPEDVRQGYLDMMDGVREKYE